MASVCIDVRVRGGCARSDRYEIGANRPRIDLSTFKQVADAILLRIKMISFISTQETVAYVEELFYDHSLEPCPLQQNEQLKLSKVEGFISIT